MASITPQNGRVDFVAAWDPHTYWELNSTNLGTNYGDDNTAGGGDNTNVAAGDISTQESYDGMNSQNDPPANGQFDVDLVNDAAALIYIPANMTHNTVRGLWHNGGGTNGQGGFLRATTTGVEIALAHNNGGDLGDYLIEEIPDADLPGWFCVSWQFNSHGGTEGDCALWLNGTAVRSGTRVYTLDYGSGNPDFGNNSAREPNASQVLDPSSYGGGDWGGNNSINGTGILIANFTCDNPSGGASDTSAGNGDTWHTDYYDDHVDAGSGEDALLADDVESDSEVTSPTIGQEHALTSTDVESTSEVSSPSLSETHALLADDAESATEVTSPAVGQEHSLGAEDVEGASEVTAPNLGQEHGLTSTSVESAAEVSTPTLAQVHVLSSVSVESTSELTAPDLTSESTVDDLLAEDLNSSSEVSTPTLAQVHVLNATSVESPTEVTEPSVFTGDVLNANSVQSQAEVSSPSLGQTHGLNVVSIEAYSQVTEPVLDGAGSGERRRVLMVS